MYHNHKKLYIIFALCFSFFSVATTSQSPILLAHQIEEERMQPFASSSDETSKKALPKSSNQAEPASPDVPPLSHPEDLNHIPTPPIPPIAEENNQSKPSKKDQQKKTDPKLPSENTDTPIASPEPSIYQPITTPSPALIDHSKKNQQSQSPQVLDQKENTSLSHQQLPSDSKNKQEYTSSSQDRRNHQISFSTGFIKWNKDGSRESTFETTIGADYGYLINPWFSIGPFFSTDIEIDMHPINNESVRNFNFVIGGFFEAYFSPNQVNKILLPSAGLKLAYGRANHRNQVAITPFGAIKFFLSPNTALQLNLQYTLSYFAGNIDIPMELGLSAGWVHYLR